MGNADPRASSKQLQRQAALKSKLQTAIFHPFRALVFWMFPRPVTSAHMSAFSYHVHRLY